MSSGINFSGVSVLSLDSKGRLAIPTRHRDALLMDGAQVIITAYRDIAENKDRHLSIYPPAAWQPVAGHIRALATSPVTNMVKNITLGYATEVDVDAGSGRVLIPPELRAFARLDKAVAFVGQGNKFELWDEAAWNSKTEEALDLSPDQIAKYKLVAEQLGGLVL